MTKKSNAVEIVSDFCKIKPCEIAHTVAAQIFTHLSVVSSRQRSYDWLRCEGIVCNGNAGLMLGCLFLFCRCISGESGGKKYLHLLGILASTAMESTVSIRL